MKHKILISVLLVLLNLPVAFAQDVYTQEISGGDINTDVLYTMEAAPAVNKKIDEDKKPEKVHVKEKFPETIEESGIREAADSASAEKVNAHGGGMSVDGEIFKETIRKKGLIHKILDEKEFVREKIGYSKPILREGGIVSPREISLDAGVLATNFLFAIVVFLIVGLSSFLFNNIVEAHGDDINKFFDRINFSKLFDESDIGKNRLKKFGILSMFVIVFGIIVAHISPDFSLFGLNNWGVLFVAIIGITIATFTKDFFRYAVTLRWKARALFKPNFLGLVLAIGCVVLSRNLEVSPGYLFGIPMGLFIYSKKYDMNAGILEFFGLFWMLLLAIGVWIFSPVIADFEILRDLFNLIYVILLEGVFFEAFPLEYLPGSGIFKWSKWVWGAFIILVIFFLFHTLFNPVSTFSALSQTAPAKNTLIVLGIYTIFSLLLWLGLSWRKKLKAV